MSFADNKFYVRMSSYRIRRHFADMTWNYWTWCERRTKRCKEFSTLHTKWTRIRAMTCKRELKNQATKHDQHSSDNILESYIIDSVLDKFCWVNTAASEIFLSNVLWVSNCPRLMTATHIYKSQWYFHHFLLIGSICGVEESHHK